MVGIVNFQQMLLDVAIELAELRYEYESLRSQLAHETERLHVAGDRTARLRGPTSLGVAAQA